MSILLSHPTGNANVRAALQGLADGGLLSSFYTGIASFPGTFLSRLGQFKPFSEIKRREFPVNLHSLTHNYPWWEAGRLLSSRLRIDTLTKHETGAFSIDEVYRKHDSFVARNVAKEAEKGVGAVYCYEDGAVLTFEAAKEAGISTLYDLPIGYWRTARHLMKNEFERWPEWRSTLTGLKDSDIKLYRKDEEIRIADRIFVASSFTAKTLEDYPGQLSNVHVIPYGFPPITGQRNLEEFKNSKKLRLLFVGGLSQRKGIANLFSVAKTLEKYVSLTIIGHKSTNDCPALDKALQDHRWIPSLPHAEVLQIMKQHDVLVFPSLFEGFGLVITEAMSQGLPVITTDRTAGPDLIEHGRNGYLIEAASTEALQDAIETFIGNPNLCYNISREAQTTAEKRPWSMYGWELAKAIQENH